MAAATERDRRPWLTVVLVLFVGSMLTRAPDRGAWWALNVIGTALYWPSFAVFVWWVVGDAWRWLRGNTLRRTAARTAYWGTYLGPIWWLCLAGLWWVTGVLLALAWIVVFVSAECLVGGFLRALRKEVA